MPVAARAKVKAKAKAKAKAEAKAKAKAKARAAAPQAKAKAAARDLRRSLNTRRNARHAALREISALAEEVGATPVRRVRKATAQQVETLVRQPHTRAGE